MKSITSKGPVAEAFDFEDQTTTQVAYLDGYQFGDRLLEGVIFKCEILKDQRLKISVTPKCQAYFKKLNQDTWLRTALAYAVRNDIFSENEKGAGRDVAFVGLVDNPSDAGDITDG